MRDKFSATTGWRPDDRTKNASISLYFQIRFGVLRYFEFWVEFWYHVISISEFEYYGISYRAKITRKLREHYLEHANKFRTLFLGFSLQYSTYYRYVCTVVSTVNSKFTASVKPEDKKRSPDLVPNLIPRFRFFRLFLRRDWPQMANIIISVGSFLACRSWIMDTYGFFELAHLSYVEFM